VLSSKGLKPGKYKPNCPKCNTSFLLVIPEDENETISVQQIAQKQSGDEPDTVRTPTVKPKNPPKPIPDTVKTPAVKPKNPPDTEPDTVRTPSIKPKNPQKPIADTVPTPAVKPSTSSTTDKLPTPASRPLIKTAPPNAQTDRIVKGSGSVKPPEQRTPQTPKEPMSLEDAAAAVLEGVDPGKLTGEVPDPTDQPSAGSNATGDFTEPEAPEKPETEVEPKKSDATPVVPPKTKRTVKPTPKPDPNATGELNSHAEPPPKKKPTPKPVTEADPNATSELTEPEKTPTKPSAGEATGDFTEPAEDETPTKKPRKKPAATGAMETAEFTEKNDSEEGGEEETEPGILKPEKKTKSRTQPETEIDADVPAKLGGYEVLKVLGKGGMGAVLLGRQISLDRKVALKVMHPKIAQNPGFVARFTREAYAAAQLTHHNVIQIYDIGEERGQHFFSMEFVQGQSLMDLVKQDGKLPADMAVGYILQAARGLRYGHNQGMVHRDIKPDNLMINTEGIVKVADLGLVKLPSGELPEQAGTLPSSEGGPGDSNLTRVGAVMGTPAYMAPEQSRDSASVDGRADIYSLGCSLYVLLTGKTPFEGKTALEIISKHQTEPLTPPEVVVKRVPKAVSAIVLKMTAKKPDDRYQSMDEVIAALEHFLGLEKTATFNPKEEQADQLEKCCHQFNYRSRAGLKKTLSLAFFLVCVLGVVGAAFTGMPALAGGFVGLMVMTPLAYFVIHGVLTGSVVFGKAREVVFGMRFLDWLMWIGGGVLCLITLYLFGMLWSWLGFAALAAGLGFVLWYITDRTQEKAQEAPLEEARGLFKTLRLSGLDEEQLRQFVCKFSGTNWEPFYEALFGYEAKLAARAYRKGETGEVSKKAGAWREVVMAWLDARLETRRVAKERKHLQKVEAKALEAEGVSKAEAKVQAAAMATELVDQAAEAKQARKEGKEVSVLQLARAARERRKPKPGYNLAGKKLRSLWFKDFLNNWFGRRLRIILGALTFAIGLLWMSQNNLFGSSTNIFKQVMEFDFATAQKSLDKAAGKPLHVPEFLPIPGEVLQVFSSINVPVLGFCLMLCGIFFYGWRPTLVAIPGLILGIAGPMLGVPAVEPLSANLICLIVGAVLIIPVAWVLRQ
jgi:serine/threonine protein kinase